jgi:quinol monooxygenase YgiN
MADAPVTVTVRMPSRPETVERMRETLTGLLPASRAEDGCLLYFMQQSQDDPTDFLLYMHGRDEEAFERHVQAPLVKDFDDHLGAELLARPYELVRWDQMG